MSALELESIVARWFEGQADLGHAADRSISLIARPGDWIGVIGENGVGKSTLLHAIAGTVTLASGRILASGVPLSHGDPVSRFQAGVYHVPQAAYLVGECYLRDAHDLVRSHRPAYYNEHALEDLFRLLRELGVVDGEKFAPRLFDLVTAIMSVPRVLLLDEILPAWPTETRSEAYERLKQLLPNTTVFFVEHSISKALKAANRILWLRSEHAPMVRAVDPSLIADLNAHFHEANGTNGGNTGMGHPLRLVRLDRSPRSELRLAIQARGEGRRRTRDFEQVVFSAFKFLDTDRPVECLSGGQQVVLLSLFMHLGNLGRAPDFLLGHLHKNYRSQLDDTLSRLTGSEQ